MRLFEVLFSLIGYPQPEGGDQVTIQVKQIST
jgi:hypothetical protein